MLKADRVRAFIEEVLPPRLSGKLDDGRNFDFSIDAGTAGAPIRFRANVFLSQGEWCACLRYVPNEIPSFDWMGFPTDLAEKLVSHRNGLVVLTGVTGSGKSTTLAGLVNLLNERGDSRIITVEEPIEYVHPRMTNSIVTQREVGRDVDSFLDGLRSGLRQDPDVILLGEIRDRETAQMALSAAETGHLILSTLHTQDAKGAVTRITDLFPRDAHDDVRSQLALSMRSIVSQHLLPPAQLGDKRVLALEVLHSTPAVRAGIRFGKIDSIESNIQTGRSAGMQSLDEHLAGLARAGKISLETAKRFAKDPEHLMG